MRNSALYCSIPSLAPSVLVHLRGDLAATMRLQGPSCVCSFQKECAERKADPWKYYSYWDWNLDWENVTRAPVWDAELVFGGNGNKSDSPGFRGFCVTDGAFSRLELPFVGPMHIPHCLTRSFPSAGNLTEYAQRIRPEAMQEVFNASTYDEFSSCLEEGPHLAIPYTIHGDFSVPTAPQGTSSSDHFYRRY